MSTSALLRRLQKLEAQKKSKFIVFKMADGTIQKLPTEDFPKVCGDALYGIRSPKTDIVINAVSCNERGHLLELLNSCIN